MPQRDDTAELNFASDLPLIYTQISFPEIINKENNLVLASFNTQKVQVSLLAYHWYDMTVTNSSFGCTLLMTWFLKILLASNGWNTKSLSNLQIAA